MTESQGANRGSERNVHVALAILERDGKYLFQLRDNIPTIVAPGQWALFGGHLESGEQSEAGLRRELREELEFEVGHVRFFGEFEHDNVIRHIFVGSLHVPISKLVLNEGQDLKLLSCEEILSGQAFSKVTGTLEIIAPHICSIFRGFLGSAQGGASFTQRT
ncbi:MAG: NUDIX domain-containing protein [Spirochaetia bacterium]|nr:NUDIX domain-containing protein [Spirochaetia bacterium]